MQVILKENVIGLGYKDDVVTVKDGYGRNYLIPTGKAVIASKAALKVLAEDVKQRAHKIAKIKADAEALAEKLGGAKPIVITAKVSPTGTIYGAVGSRHIAEALKEQGFDIDSKIIQVKDVKEVGEYVAHVKLYKEVSVEMPFTVVAEGGTEPAAEEAAVEEAPVAPEAEAAEEEVMEAEIEEAQEAAEEAAEEAAPEA